MGSERLYRQLSSRAHVMLVREDEPPHACLDLRPDALVLETCGEAVLASWRQQLCGSEGEIGATAAALLAEAKARNIPVTRDRLGPELGLYRELIERADRVIVAGMDADRNSTVAAILPGKVVHVPRSFERTLAAPVVEIGRGGFRMIIPNAAFLLTSEDHYELVAKLDGANILPHRRIRRPERDADRQSAAVHAVASGEQAAVS